MTLFIPKALFLLFIQVSLILNFTQAACDIYCQTCGADGFSCESCSGGSILAQGSTSCSVCPGGSYSLAGSSECTLCPGGKYAPSGSSACLTCQTEMYSGEGAEQCSLDCGVGFWQDGTKRACVACIPGSWSRLGDLKCSLCPAGSIPDAAQSSCVPCGANLWSSPGDSECSPCPAGSILDGSACVSCGAGLWANSGCGDHCEACDSSKSCRECTYPTENRYGNCVLSCPQGYFISSSGCLSNCFVYKGRFNWIGCSANCQECQSESDCTVCQSGYVRQLDENTGFYTCSPKPKNPEKEATKSSSITLSATSAVAKSLSSGSSGALGFGVVAKVIRNVRYFSIAYSEKTQEIFAAEGSSSFELNAPGSFDNIDSKQLHENFVKYDVEPNFLINYWGNLIPILILSGCFVVLKVLKKHLSQSRERILTHKMVRMIQITAGNYLVNNLYGSFDEIVLYFLLEVQTCTFSSALSWMSFICALVFLIIGLSFFGFHFDILTKYQAAKSQKEEKKLEAFKVEHAQVKILYEDFRDDSLAQQSFLASFMIRASLLNVLLCFFVNYPLVEAFLYLGVNLIFALFLVIKRPYEEFKGAAAQYFCEAIILITYTCALILALMDHNGTQAESQRELLEKIIVILGIALNVGGTVFQCLDILIGVCLYIKSFKIWRGRLKIAKAPVGLVSKAAGNHVDLTFMKAKSGLKIHPAKEEDGGLVGQTDSPTRLISVGLDTETERASLPSIGKPSTIVFTGESQDDLDYEKGTRVFQIDLPRRTSTIIFTGESENDLDYQKRTEIAPESRKRIVSASDKVEKEGEAFGDLMVFDYEKAQK